MPTKLPLLGLMGLFNPSEGDWSRVRSIQYNRFANQRLTRWLINFVATLIVLKSFWGDVPVFLLVGWSAAIIGCSTALNYIFVKSGDNTPKHVGNLDLLRITAISGLLAVFWAAPIVFFQLQTGQNIGFIFWLVLAALLAGAAIFHASIPQSAFAFIAVLAGITSTVCFLSDQTTLAVVTLLFASLLIYASIQLAFDYVRFKVSEVGLSEKSEVVSLLLREFEESGADWLWQIDASRRVIHVSPRFAFALGRDANEIEGESLIKLIAGPSWDSGNFSTSLHDLAEKLKRRESFSNLMVRVQIVGVVSISKTG